MMPQAILPLHIFEHRYRRMTRDALASDRVIAMAVLKPGFEESYHTLNAEIYPEICVGRILKEEELPDGRFHILLQGLVRAQVVNECKQSQYRRAVLRPIFPEVIPTDVEYAFRRELRRLFTTTKVAQLATESQWLDLFKTCHLSFSDLLDALASKVLQDTDHKRCFLAEPRTVKRAQCLCGMLQALEAELESTPTNIIKERCWPPKQHEN